MVARAGAALAFLFPGILKYIDFCDIDPVISDLLAKIPGEQFRELYRDALVAAVDRNVCDDQISECADELKLYKRQLDQLDYLLPYLRREADDAEAFVMREAEKLGLDAYISEKLVTSDLADWINPACVCETERYSGYGDQKPSK